ncbi:permease [Desulfosporosinus nitroreducens]|uniref:permease n=1 Tax=Desulfosporosinus nitroreducens TaxID=2018668 RepID=UPI00207D341F|nr:permease [Desulfosporosinus nitroreducens]MCO1602353.1 permease [Desulfosporosinus nitroreducens]
MKMLAKRYKYFLALIVINMLVYILYPSVGQKSMNITWNNTVEMLSVIPPIFVLLGLLDVWVQRETMIKLMGEKSGIVGILIAFFLGSAAAGPLYAAFPIAGVLLHKGSKFSNVLIFIGAWSTTKIPMLLFEASAMGWKFMLTRFVIDIPGIMVIAYVTEKLLNEKEKQYIYDQAGNVVA